MPRIEKLGRYLPNFAWLMSRLREKNMNTWRENSLTGRTIWEITLCRVGPKFHLVWISKVITRRTSPCNRKGIPMVDDMDNDDWQPCLAKRRRWVTTSNDLESWRKNRSILSCHSVAKKCLARHSTYWSTVICWAKKHLGVVKTDILNQIRRNNVMAP